MVFPSAFAYPVVRNPIIFRAAAILPAAPLWDAAPIAVAVAGIQRITFYITYLRGAAGGAIDTQIQVSPYSVDQIAPWENWFDQDTKRFGIVAAGVNTQSFIQAEYDTYTSLAATECYVSGSFHLAGCVERIRIRARENAALAPGTATIIGVVYSEP
jgi:hypothetical protein